MKWIFLVALIVFVAWWYEQQKAAVSQAAGGSYGLPDTYGGGSGAMDGAYSRNTTPLFLNSRAGIGPQLFTPGDWPYLFGTSQRIDSSLPADFGYMRGDNNVPAQFQAVSGGTFGTDAEQIGSDPWNNGVGCRGADGIPHCVILRNVN